MLTWQPGLLHTWATRQQSLQSQIGARTCALIFFEPFGSPLRSCRVPSAAHAPKAPWAPLPCATEERLQTVGARRRLPLLLLHSDFVPCSEIVDTQAAPQQVVEIATRLQQPLARANVLYSRSAELGSVL